VVLLVSDYPDSYLVPAFVACFLRCVSCRIVAAVVGNYNFPIEAVFLQKFAGGFDVSPDFA
jgi:hypothetical protein